jgi:glutamyl-tRNA synthetase
MGSTAFAHLPLILKPIGNGQIVETGWNKQGFQTIPIGMETEETTATGYRENGFRKQ